MKLNYWSIQSGQRVQRQNILCIFHSLFYQWPGFFLHLIRFSKGVCEYGYPGRKYIQVNWQVNNHSKSGSVFVSNNQIQINISTTIYQGGSSDPPKNVSPKKSLSQPKLMGVQKSRFFKIMLQRGVNNTHFQIVKPDRSSSLQFEIHPSLKHFWKKCLFQKPIHLG